MIELKFPDGAVRQYPAGSTGRDVAAAISPSLAKKAALVVWNGEQRDLDRVIDGDGDFRLLMRDDAEALETIRHDAAHVLAQAVQELFPGTQVTIGPAIEDGFYYDFARDEPFSTDDFPKIEKKMAEIIDRGAPLERQVWNRDEAIAHFEKIGEAYKAELIRDLPETETITVYKQGEWADLCRGPHFPTTKFVGKAFKLTKLAGAYWRGDSNRAQLQRIYGTAWATKEDLDAYLLRIEEAEKRDHRKLGRAMELFHMQEEGRGMVFWHPKGWVLWRVLEAYMRRRLDAAGYVEVKTPQVLDRKFWEASGHWDKYRANMFVCETVEGETLSLKPMNCPGHVQVFNQGLHSYRDLPIRYGEFGACHRNEPSGALHGILRVRGFTQDDGHVFCTEDQVEAEVTAFHQQALAVYQHFGFEEIQVKIALRPESRLGDDATWDKAEGALRSALSSCGVEWQELPGEGAFYGPKIEYHLKDAIGRTWQLGTMQVDFMMPGRLGAEYVDENSQKKHPVMLHRAIVGSMERFLGILIEHHAGQFPSWLAPTQVVVANITDAQAEYVNEVRKTLADQGFRVNADLRNE
ncbi:MAG TPA: threonine--tRNA ligase, partial [Brevundimonas diminuta]|nr:threonine--tRNA ligase [Brevundimonas diminuta]